MKRTILLILTLTLILGHTAFSSTDEGLKKLQTWPKGLEMEYILEELKNLSELDLSYQLTALLKEIVKLTNLQRLELNGNQLTALHKEIGKLTKLQFLYLQANPLSDKEKKKIKKLFYRCYISFEEE